MSQPTDIGKGMRQIALASRIFLVVAVGALCAAVALLAYHQGAFTPRIHAHFFAGTADGMHTGMAVKLVGFKVGALESIAINSDLRVKGVIAIDAKYAPMIDVDAAVRLAKESVIGSNVLEIRPGSGDRGPIKQAAELRYEREPSLEGAIVSLVDQFAPIVAEVRQITATLNNPESDFRQAIRNVNRTADAVSESAVEAKRMMATATDRIDKGETRVREVLDTADGMMREARQAVARLDGTLSKVDAALPGIASKMDRSLDNLLAASEIVRGLATDELPGLVDEAGALLANTGDIVRGTRRSWPVRSLAPPRQELRLRLDSGGGLSPVPVESAPGK